MTATINAISDNQIIDDRIKALMGIYQGMDSILTGARVKVSLADALTEAPAWSTGSEIVFNSRLIKHTDLDDIMRMHGLNVHELSHVLFSPRKGSTLMASVIEEDLVHTMNILEDQRIESLITAMYPSTRPWLQATVGRWILNNTEDNVHMAYILLRGRRYLPGTLRGAARAVWPKQDLLPSIDRIIDEYRMLVYPNDYERGLELIREFDALLNDLQDSLPSDPHGHGSRPTEVGDKGRPKGVSEQRRARDRMTDGEPEQSPENTSHDSEQEASGSSDDTEESSTREQGDEASNAGTAQDSSQGSATTPSASIADLIDQASDLVDAVMSDRDVQKEIQRAQRQILGRSASDALGDARRSNLEDPMPEYRRSSNQFRKVLERLKMQADPGWEMRQSSGRVNPLRWSQERDIESAFDRWEEGVHDATDLEVVILIDESGSMQGRMLEAANAAWATKRALDHIQASTSVISFSTQSRFLYQSHEKAGAQMRFSFHGGGTDPIDALRQSAGIFQYSRRAQKILLIFTDGIWNPSQDTYKNSSEDYIERLNRSGVITALGYIPDASGEYEGMVIDAHKCKVSSTVNSDALAKFMQKIVTATIRQRLSHR